MVMSVVLIGSSGGGVATLGHSDPSEFFEIISSELSKIEGSVHLSEVVFVCLTNGKGMDVAKDDDEAKLYHFRSGSQNVSQGSLRQINESIAEIDESLANDIELGKVNGMISVSCKPSLFHQTLEAAAEMKVPLTGTGGSSLSMISSNYQLNLFGNAGGSVATTPLTKAISFSHALAVAWNLKYRPWLAISNRNAPSWRSVLNSCLPAFWAVTVFRRALEYGVLNESMPSSDILQKVIQNYALPVTCSVVMASSRRNTPGVLMGAIFAACSCEGTVLGGLIAGWLVAFLEEKLLYFCIIYGNVPATMTSLLTTGLVGVSVAVFMTPFTPKLAGLTEIYRLYITRFMEEEGQDEGNVLMESFRIFLICMVGAVFCYGSKIGWYHSIFLPLILLEMELGEASILGAIDQLSLVMVSAGICTGKYLTSMSSRNSVSKSLALRGLFINLLCGDFIEACYPFMEANPIIQMGGYVASATSVGLLSSRCKSSAYLPLPLAILLAEDSRRLAISSCIAFGISFGSALLGSLLARDDER